MKNGASLAAWTALAGGLCWAQMVALPAFYPDDPLWVEPAPEPVGQVAVTSGGKISAVIKETFAKASDDPPSPAGNVNTLDEAPDSPWYTNRHRNGRMSLEAIAAGPGSGNPPSQGSPWQVVEAKVEGVTPGFTIEDEFGGLYVLKFDVPDYPEMASAAEAIGARFFHALGYFVPETHVVTFGREQFQLADGANFERRDGAIRAMTKRDLEQLLLDVKPRADGRYRAVASRIIPGKPVGPFAFEGTRADDPNDIIPHEDRREIRGLRLFSAWLGHTEVALSNSYDVVVETDGIAHIRHYLIDFGATLGSGSTEPKDPHEGFEYEFSAWTSLRNLVTLGLAAPAWARAHYPELHSVGRFEATEFDPETWKPRFPVRAFDHCTLRDDFWAAKQIAAFSSDEIRAVVAAGQYTNPEAADWLTRCLILRRDKIVRTYLPRLLALDDFRIAGGELRFTRLAEGHHIDSQGALSVEWSTFDNQTRELRPMEGAVGVAVPASAAEYLAARVRAAQSGLEAVVYVRNGGPEPTVVGLDRDAGPRILQRGSE